MLSIGISNIIVSVEGYKEISNKERKFETGSLPQTLSPWTSSSVTLSLLHRLDVRLRRDTLKVDHGRSRLRAWVSGRNVPSGKGETVMMDRLTRRSLTQFYTLGTHLLNSPDLPRVRLIG